MFRALYGVFIHDHVVTKVSAAAADKLHLSSFQGATLYETAKPAFKRSSLTEVLFFSVCLHLWTFSHWTVQSTPEFVSLSVLGLVSCCRSNVKLWSDGKWGLRSAGVVHSEDGGKRKRIKDEREVHFKIKQHKFYLNRMAPFQISCLKVLLAYKYQFDTTINE